MPWTEKYSPKKVAEVVGQKKAVNQLLAWLRGWKPGREAALFHGPPGVGKTCLVEAISTEKDLDIMEMNASDLRTASQVQKVIGQSMRQKSLFKRGKIFLLDEIDGLVRRVDIGGVREIVKIIRESKFPVILTANDPWNPKLRYLRSNCRLIQFGKVRYWDIVKKLDRICEEEEIFCDKEILRRLAKRSEGDLRSAINDLETLMRGRSEVKMDDLEGLGFREKGVSIFDALKMIFKTQTALAAKLSVKSIDKDPDETFWWIEENVINEYERPGEIAKAYDALSKADLFRGRMKIGQNWRLMEYMIDLMTGGVALAKTEMYRKFSRYRYPSMIKILGMTKAKRKKEKEELSRLAKRLHCSTRKVRQEFLPFFR